MPKYFIGWLHLLHSVNETPTQHNLYYVIFVIYDDIRPYLELWPDLPSACLHSEPNVQRISLAECRLVSIAIGSFNAHLHSLQVTLNLKKIILSTKSVQVINHWIWTLKETLQKLNILSTTMDIEYSIEKQSLPLSSNIEMVKNNYEPIYPMTPFADSACIDSPTVSSETSVSFRETQVNKLQEEMTLSFNNNGLCFMVCVTFVSYVIII